MNKIPKPVNNTNIIGTPSFDDVEILIWHAMYVISGNHKYLKINEYLSSPKEASRNAEAAFLGASAMFEGFKMGILECCQVLPSMEPVFIAYSHEKTHLKAI